MSEGMIPSESEILLYTTPTRDIRVEVLYQDETFWLSQRRMAELFGVESHTITYHCKEIFASKKLEEEGTTQKIRVVQKEGARDVSREVDFYNLDMVIAVGYRVNSFQATQFRIWATKALREFILKGFVPDLLSAVHWYRCCASVQMLPAFMAASLPCLAKSELR